MRASELPDADARQLEEVTFLKERTARVFAAVGLVITFEHDNELLLHSVSGSEQAITDLHDGAGTFIPALVLHVVRVEPERREDGAGNDRQEGQEGRDAASDVSTDVIPRFLCPVDVQDDDHHTNEREDDEADDSSDIPRIQHVIPICCRRLYGEVKEQERISSVYIIAKNTQNVNAGYVCMGLCYVRGAGSVCKRCALISAWISYDPSSPIGSPSRGSST